MEKDRPINKVCLDAGDIFTRLFDHRPFLNGEIQHFVREFEDKKGSKDIECLLKSCEKLTDLNDLLKTSVAGDNTIELLSNFLQCISKTTLLVESVSSPKAPEENTDSSAREALRQQKKQEYLENNTQKLASLENLIKEKELELQTHYKLLEDKLKTSNQ